MKKNNEIILSYDDDDKNNKIVPSGDGDKNNNNALSNLSDSGGLNMPNGSGRFETGIDGRGNPYDKRDYDGEEQLSIKQELLHSGKLKVTVTKKIK